MNPSKGWGHRSSQTSPPGSADLEYTLILNECTSDPCSNCNESGNEENALFGKEKKRSVSLTRNMFDERQTCFPSLKETGTLVDVLLARPVRDQGRIALGAKTLVIFGAENVVYLTDDKSEYPLLHLLRFFHTESETRGVIFCTRMSGRGGREVRQCSRSRDRLVHGE